MIALDANILVRYFVGDDPDQAALAKAFIEDELTPDRPGLVTPVVLVELEWVLKRVYGLSTASVAAIVRTLLDASQILVEYADAVGAALAHGHEDFADAVIHEIGKENGCVRTVTFDRRFARLEGVTLLTR